MPCTIVSNNIPSAELREAVSEAVRDGIGERPGEWNIVVYQAPDYLGFAVRIEGPKNLRWSWTFREEEQVSDFSLAEPIRGPPKPPWPAASGPESPNFNLRRINQN